MTRARLDQADPEGQVIRSAAQTALLPEQIRRIRKEADLSQLPAVPGRLHARRAWRQDHAATRVLELWPAADCVGEAASSGWIV